jgi:hypothetical protein
MPMSLLSQCNGLLAATQRSVLAKVQGIQARGMLPTVQGWSPRSEREEKSKAGAFAQCLGAAAAFTWKEACRKGMVCTALDQNFLDKQEEAVVLAAADVLKMIILPTALDSPFKLLGDDVLQMITNAVIDERVYKFKAGDFERTLYYISDDGMIFGLHLQVRGPRGCCRQHTPRSGARPASALTAPGGSAPPRHQHVRLLYTHGHALPLAERALPPRGRLERGADACARGGARAGSQTARLTLARWPAMRDAALRTRASAPTAH